MESYNHHIRIDIKATLERSQRQEKDQENMHIQTKIRKFMNMTFCLFRTLSGHPR